MFGSNGVRSTTTPMLPSSADFCLMALASFALWLPQCGAARADEPSQSTSRAAGNPGDTSGKPPEEHLLGDWGGERTALHDAGLDLTVKYTGETAAIVSGGARKGIDYAGQIEIKAAADLGRLAGLNGLSLHMTVINRHGRNASADFLDDHVFQVQEIYGGGGDVGVHLVSFYAQQKFPKDKIDLEGGRIPVGNDFANSPLNCDFMTDAICGSPHSLPAKGAFTIFPNSTWGGRLKVKPLSDIYVEAGAYQVRPLFGGRSGFDWSGSGTTGAYFPVEIGYEPSIGAAMLVGHYKLGATYDTSTYPDLYFDAAGDPIAFSGLPGRPHQGRGSVYVLADQMLARAGKGPTDGIIVMGGYVHSSPATSPLEDLAYAGVLASGVVPGRPKDAIGLLVIGVKVSGALEGTQELEAMRNLPLMNMADGVQTRETVIEANYDIHVVDGFHLMPDFQYVIRPGAATRFPNAVVIGLKVGLSL